MDIINNYCNNLKSKYINTKEVLEQIEELRDTIHIKTEEYQEKGYKYSDAAKEAIASLGDIDCLFEELTTDVKMVYDARISLLTNILSTIIIFALAITIWRLSIAIPFLNGINETVFLGFINLSIATFVVYAVQFNDMVYLNEKRIVKNSSKKKYRNIKNSIMIFIIVSIITVIINFYTTTLNRIWFVWFIIGVANWPIATLIYYKLLESNKFDLK